MRVHWVEGYFCGVDCYLVTIYNFYTMIIAQLN
jgi:hypothetical protein